MAIGRTPRSNLAFLWICISLYLCLCLCLCFQLSFWEVVGNWLGSRSNLQRRTLRSQDFERGPIKRNCLLQTICFNEMSIQLFPRYKKTCSAIKVTCMTANKTPNARSKQSDSFSLRLFRPISPMQSRPDYKIDTTIDCNLYDTVYISLVELSWSRSLPIVL